MVLSYYYTHPHSSNKWNKEIILGLIARMMKIIVTIIERGMMIMITVGLIRIINTI